MTKFEEWADAPAPDGTAGGASETKPPQEDGRLSTIHEDAEADLEAHVMEVWCADLQDDKELLEATPRGDLFAMPAPMIPGSSALITVAEEQRGHLP
eukprot:7480006-Pyramimonas_sp.AAC.1